MEHAGKQGGKINIVGEGERGTVQRQYLARFRIHRVGNRNADGEDCAFRSCDHVFSHGGQLLEKGFAAVYACGRHVCGFYIVVGDGVAVKRG